MGEGSHQKRQEQTQGGKGIQKSAVSIVLEISEGVVGKQGEIFLQGVGTLGCKWEATYDQHN